MYSILDKLVVRKNYFKRFAPMRQGNATGGVVHKMVLAERWTPENRNLFNLTRWKCHLFDIGFNLILIGNVQPPIRHWCSPSVLPLPHSSPLSSKPALQEPRRTSHPEREEEIRIMLCLVIFPPCSPSRSRFIGSWSRRGCGWKRRLSRLGSLPLGVDRQLVDSPGHRGEEFPAENETVRKPVKP